MTFDNETTDDMRDRFTNPTPTVSDLDAGAAAAAQSAGRRTAVLRGAGAIVVIAAAAFGALALVNRANGPSDVATTTPDVADIDLDVPDNAVAEEPGPAIAPIDISQTVGIVTVDVDGVVRINGDEVDTSGIERIVPDDTPITGADGASGLLAYQTNMGIFVGARLIHEPPDGTLHDYDQENGFLASWTDRGADDGTSNPLLAGWRSEDDQETFLLDLESEPIAASFGPDGLLLVTLEGDSCSRIFIMDQAGELASDYGINERSACLPGEIAEWSAAGEIVLVRPTEEDSWRIDIIGSDGASVVIPGAFQPRALDVHTTPDGRTEALILGTGEELVYVDVDRFLSAEDPMVAVHGISNETNLVSARLVSGFPPHPYRPLEVAPDVVVPKPEPEPPTEEPELEPESEPTEPTATPTEATVFNVQNVDSDDTLNARSGPGIENDVLYEFAYNATGVVATGAAPVQVGGGEWIEVFAPTDDGEGLVWVNRAFLEQTAVPDARPCMFNGPQDHYIGIDWANTDGDDSSDAAVVSNIETYRFGGCLRTVIEFSSGWSYEDNIVRSTTLPRDIVVRRSEDVTIRSTDEPTIDFGSSIVGAEVASQRFAEQPGVAHSTFLYMGEGRTIDGLLYGPTSIIFVRFDNENGRLIIDTAAYSGFADEDIAVDPVLRERIGGSLPLVDENSLILTDLSSRTDERQWTFSGLARPFESSLAVDITANGSPLEVEWTNGVLSEATATNGVMTSTWTEAQGAFQFSITLPDDVDPADVVVVFDPTGGAADDPETVDIAIADYLS